MPAGIVALILDRERGSACHWSPRPVPGNMDPQCPSHASPSVPSEGSRGTERAELSLSHAHTHCTPVPWTHQCSQDGRPDILLLPSPFLKVIALRLWPGPYRGCWQRDPPLCSPLRGEKRGKTKRPTHPPTHLLFSQAWPPGTLEHPTHPGEGFYPGCSKPPAGPKQPWSGMGLGGARVGGGGHPAVRPTSFQLGACGGEQGSDGGDWVCSQTPSSPWPGQAD